MRTVCRQYFMKADQLRNYRDAMSEHIARVESSLRAGDDLVVDFDELESLRELFVLSRAAIDRHYQTSVIRDLEFDALTDTSRREVRPARRLRLWR